MLMGFEKRFADDVRSGRKRHSIRHWRMNPGEICHCYVNPRQKTMRLLGRWPCVKVEEILITLCYGESAPDIWIERQRLSEDERDEFAKRDGFPGGWPEMLAYWEAKGTAKWAVKLFRGYVIHWDYEHPVQRTGKRRRAKARGESA